MHDQSEEILPTNLESTFFTLSKESLDTLVAQSNEVLVLYSSDSMYAAQRGYVCIALYQPKKKSVPLTLFGAEWEESLPHNELSPALLCTLEDYMHGGLGSLVVGETHGLKGRRSSHYWHRAFTFASSPS